MSAAAVKESLTRQPFQPFRILLSSGASCDVRHPENALMVKAGVYVAVPGEKGELPEAATWCSLLHVTAVEPLSASKAR